MWPDNGGKGGGAPVLIDYGIVFKLEKVFCVFFPA
jgi:hypothetical protein